MKEVIAVIRRNKYYKTKDALIENNFYSISAVDVLGRGKNGVDYLTGDNKKISNKIEHPYVAKKLINIFCRDEDLERLLEVIKESNCTNNPGDGKIFVMDVEDGIRIRTGENGINSVM